MAKTFALALALMLGAASAFTTAFNGAKVATRASRATSSLQMGLQPPVGTQGGMDELGILSPIGFWDPLGFATTPEKFRRYREVELKHGRIAMAAVLGYLVQENFRFPGLISFSEDKSFSDIPNGLAAISAVPGFGWFQIVLLAGILEAGPFKQETDALPGDFGLKYFGKKLPDGDEKADKLNKELSNGRLAMLGILGALVEDKITGSFLPVGIPGIDFVPGA